MLSELTFFYRPTLLLPPHQAIAVMGNVAELGLWTDCTKHPLVKEAPNSDYWKSHHPLCLPLFSTFQYKMVIIEKNNVVYWENLPFNTNRSYTVHDFAITLKAVEGDLLIQEIAMLGSPDTGPVEADSAMIRRNNIKKLKKKTLDDTLYSEIDITLEGPDEFKERTLNSSSSLLNLQSSERKINKKLRIKDKISSEKTCFRHLKKKITKESHSISDASLSSLMMSSHDSRKELASIKIGPFVKEVEEEKTLKRMDLQQLYNKMIEKTPNKLRGFSLLRSQNDIVYQITEDYIINLNYEEVVYTIIGYLPVTLNYDRKDSKWNVCFNHPARQILKYGSHFFSQARNQYKKMVWVGMLYDDVPDDLQAGLRELLYENYRCLVVFPKRDVHLNYILYCYEYLDPILSNSFNQANCYFEMLERFTLGFDAFRSVNEMLADAVAEHSKDNPLIFVIDYHLLLVNFYLSKKIVKPAIVFYYGMTFPCYENFQLLQFNEELLSSMLLANIICFDEFPCARQFLLMISTMMGLKYEARKGELMVRYMGRQIKIKVASMGIDSTYVEMLKRSAEFFECSKELGKQFEEKRVILSIDPLNKLALLDVKFKCLAKFFGENSYLRDCVEMFQVISPNFWDMQMLLNGVGLVRMREYLENLRLLVEELGPNFHVIINIADYDAIRNKDVDSLFKGFEIKSLSNVEIYGLMSIARLFLKTAIKSDNCVEALEFLFLNETNGQALFSDFLSLNPLFLRFNRFNPFSYEEFKLKFQNIVAPVDKILEAMTLPFAESNASFLKKQTIITWLEALLYDLKKSILFAKHANLTKVEKLTSYHSITYFKLATNDFFKYLNIKETMKNYRNTYNRIIIFDYEGTLVESNQFSDPNDLIKDPDGDVPVIVLKPSETMLEGLRLLCNDPRNSVYLITGKSPSALGTYVLDIRNLNIFCEYGYLIRLKRAGNEWIRLYKCNDWRWKDKGKEIMRTYVRHTQGSAIHEKDSGVVWTYGEVPEDFGWKQAELLEKQLRSELMHFQEIDIIRGRYYVEIRPYGINKVVRGL